ncbi:MAG: hypothetical protein JEY96_20025 [Bacteroidales bacterium]|nr:hypothetical protein [Bacteroidales bacterium]
MDFVKQIQISEKFQGIYLTEFSLIDKLEQDEHLIINKFLKSNSFSYDCLPEIVKQSNVKSDYYLRQLFDTDKISFEDFRKLNKKEISNFFINYSNESDWGDDRKEFKTLLEKFISLLHEYPSDKFYLISQDWFDIDSKKMRNPENWIYTYYFLVIWFDREKKTMIVCDWNYD